jgi:hypothetical protein
MQFKTTDLLVTVLPKSEIADKDLAKICLWGTRICRFPTFHCGPLSCYRVSIGCGTVCSLNQTCGYCSLFGTGGGGCHFLHSCGPGGSACDPTIFCAGGSRDPFVIQHMEDLVALRAELQTTLKSLDVLQKEGLPSALGSKADAEALERGLTEALEQVRAAKKGR